MTNLLKWGAVYLAACLGLVSCGDDNNDEPNAGGSESGDNVVLVNPSNVFTEATPKSVMGTSVTYNEAGLVTEMRTQDGKVMQFVYGTKLISRTTDADKTVSMTVTEEDGYKFVLNMEIGDNGFVKYCEEIEPEGEMDYWWFGYNEDNQLNYMKRSEGGNEVTNITYEGGNITKVSMYSEEDGESADFTISYTSEAFPNMLDNKGCILLFDETFGIDMDEMKYAYFAGLLGKATKNLPVFCKETSSTDGWQDEEYTWTLNADKLPIVLEIKATSQYGGEYEESLTFEW